MWRIEMWQLQQYSAPGWMYRWHRRGLQLWFGESGWGGESSLYHRFFQFPDLTIWNVIEFEQDLAEDLSTEALRRGADQCLGDPWDMWQGNLFTTIADIFSFFGFFIYPEDPECSRCQRSKHRPHVAKTLPRDELSHIIEEVWDLSTFRHAGLASWNVQLTQVRKSLSLSEVSLHFGSGHPRPKSCLKFLNFLNLLLHVYCCSYSELGSSLAFSCFGGRLELPYGCEDHLSSS